MIARRLSIRIAPLLALLMLLAGAGTAAASDHGGYLLGPGDQIEINVTSYPDLKTAARIAGDGTVILPLVGSVHVADLNPADAANEIEVQYVRGGFIKLPTVRVEILDYQSRKASVLGQVNTQGLIVLDRPYSVAEIIARAGGLNAEAADSATIVRQKPGGGSERLTVDLNALVATGGDSGGTLTAVQAGDVVFVPKAPTFSVIGAVNKAGTYRLTTGMTVQQALAAAGDIARIGTRSGLKVRRAGPNGGAAQTVTVSADDVVQPGDVIIVRERLF